MASVPHVAGLDALREAGFVHLRGPFARCADAWAHAQALVEALSGAGAATVIGTFVIPPADGPPSRDFQTLHVDFGVPLVPCRPMDVARFTALYVPVDVAPSGARTRLVSLRRLLADRGWPGGAELLRRFARYGETHGAWDITAGYTEGSLARIVEAAAGDEPVLPGVRTTPGFQCGLEFAGLGDEMDFFAHRGLPLSGVESEVCVCPGELLVFDNLALAHGRRGTRRPGELRQRVFGHRALDVEAQVQLRDRLLSAFGA